MKIVRVGTFSNYNWTSREAYELELMRAVHPDCAFFVNSNGETPLHHDPGVPAVLTLDPYLDHFKPPCPDRFLERVKWTRLKWVFDPIQEVADAMEAAIAWAKERDLPIVYTIMRFFSKVALKLYVKNPFESYERDPHNNIYWPRKGPEGVFVCDRVGGGCPTCGYCSALTYGIDAPVAALELHSSLPPEGHCIYDCPECWSKRRLRTAALSKHRPKAGIIRFNKKQRGKKGKD